MRTKAVAALAILAPLALAACANDAPVTAERSDQIVFGAPPAPGLPDPDASDPGTSEPAPTESEPPERPTSTRDRGGSSACRWMVRRIR